LTWIRSIMTLIVSFHLMIMVGRKPPFGTVYAVFVGLGTARTAFFRYCI